MNGPKRILVLHDSLEFGGHERAFLTWLPGLLSSPGVAGLTVVYPEVNRAFRNALEPFAGPKLALRPSPFAKRRAEPYLAPFRRAYQRRVRAVLADVRPDIVLLLQGRIENLAAAMLAVGEGPELVSYVPLAHSGREMGRWPPAARLTDAVKRLYYARPDRFIVPSPAVGDQLRRAGARGDIHVVRNVPVGERRSEVSDAGKLALYARRGWKLVLYMGRIERRQKGLDLLLHSMEACPTGLSDYEFVFVGRGPDEAWLQSRLAGMPHVFSRIAPWTSDPGSILAAAQAVVLPSRFEGVPLVLLEALSARVPILASPIDVFREYLPPENLFEFGGRADLGSALAAVVSPEGAARFETHARALDPLMSLTASSDRFTAALLGQGGAQAAGRPAIEGKLP